MISPPTPRFTVLILTLNYQDYIAQAIQSVQQQNCADWELFICDDASTDDTAKVVEPFLADPRIHFVRRSTNLGQAGNWSLALDLGTAPLIGVLHADDYWLPETLSAVLQQFDQNSSLDVVYGNWLIHRGGGAPLKTANQRFDETMTGPQTFAHQIKRNLWLPSAFFLKRSLLPIAGKPDLRLSMAVDVEFHLRAASRARQVRCISQALAVYRIHQKSVTARSWESGTSLRETQQLPDIIEEWAGKDPLLGRQMPVIRRIAAEAIYSAGVTAAVNGDRVAACNLICQAVDIYAPTGLKPKLLLDRLLLRAGPIGHRLLCYLHRNRIAAC